MPTLRSGKSDRLGDGSWKHDEVGEEGEVGSWKELGFYTLSRRDVRIAYLFFKHLTPA